MNIIKRIALAVLCLGITVAPLAARAADVYYTIGGNSVTKIFAIKFSHGKITTTDVGPTNGGGCASLAMSKWGTLYSMCGNLFGAQQLATIDLNTGNANLFGTPVNGLAVMSIAFAPDGTLYAIGDCNPDPSHSFECHSGADPNYNSLYTVDGSSGAFTRVGATGAPQYFMDLAFDRHGKMFGVTTTLNPSYTPAILYQLNLATGAATQIAILIGSSQLMGLAFGEDGALYATDFVNNPGLYLIDMKTGFQTAIAALPFGFSSSLKLVKSDAKNDED